MNAPVRRPALEALALAAACVAVLLPFAGKAFHADDPLFLWVARHVQSCPLDFYGFSVNWYGYEMPMAEVTKNPPLTSYYIALAAAVLGWSEVALHCAFLLPAVSAVLGVHAVARRLCERPVVAALAAMLTPAFLVSSTNVMSDTLLLAFWVWAVALWLRGLEGGRSGWLVASAVLMALATLTKHFGAALVPLLAAYSLASRRRLEGWALHFLIPAAALLGYGGWFLALYGHDPFSDVAAYAAGYRTGRGATPASGALTGLAFAGGSLLGLAVLAAARWSWRRYAAGAAAVALGTLLLPYAGAIGPIALNDASGVRWGLVIELGVCAAAGALLLAVAAADLRARRDAGALLLFLWSAGTLLFAVGFNWSVNARSLLPMAPALAIVVARRLDRHLEPPPRAWPWRSALMVPGLVVALAAAWADHELANSARTAARLIRAHAGSPAGTLWFQGHWGFQLYMEAAGGRAMDWRLARLAPGDLVVVPEGNTNLFPLPSAPLHPWRVVEIPLRAPLATMSATRGAGFYSDTVGPLPLAVGPVPAERYFVYRVLPPSTSAADPRRSSTMASTMAWQTAR